MFTSPFLLITTSGPSRPTCQGSDHWKPSVIGRHSWPRPWRLTPPWLVCKGVPPGACHVPARVVPTSGQALPSESSELLQCGVGGPMVSGGCQGSQNSPAEHSSLARDSHPPHFRMTELKLSPGTEASVTPSPVTPSPVITPAVGPIFLPCVMACWVTSGGALHLRPHAQVSTTCSVN